MPTEQVWKGKIPALPDDLVQLAAEAFRENGSNKAAAARALNLPITTYKNRLNVAAARGMLGFDPVLPGFRISKTSTVENEDGETVRRFIQQRPESGGKFEIPEGHVVKGISALVDQSGDEVLKWVKTREDLSHTLSTIRTTVDELKAELPRIEPSKGPPHVTSRLLNQYTLTDLHFGMLCWGEETGGADYDLRIAEQILMDWFRAAVAMAPNAEVGLLAQLGDLMHHDSLESVTPTNRNVLDADSRLQKVIRVVIRVVRQILAMMLQKYPQVHVIMASANHDPASSAWMRELLRAMYENEPRITIDNSPDIYYHYEWGKTALFYHHGHKRKISNVDTVFAGKFREIYGRCSKSYGHIGHLHSDEVKEGNLMKIERHRTLAPADAFSSSGGWLSDRDAKIITYSKEFGEVSRIIISPEMMAAAE